MINIVLIKMTESAQSAEIKQNIAKSKQEVDVRIEPASSETGDLVKSDGTCSCLRCIEAVSPPECKEARNFSKLIMVHRVRTERPVFC